MLKSRKCQTVDFYMDWHVISIFKVFNSDNDGNIMTQEDLLRKSGLQYYALDAAIGRINQKIKDCITARPEYDDLPFHQKIGKAMEQWLQSEYDFMFKGKWPNGSKRTMGYKLAPNIEVKELREDNVVVRVYKNGD